MEGNKGNTSNLVKNNNPYAKSFGVKCYRCSEVGHRSNECPKRKAVNVVEKSDDVLKEEVCEPYEDDDCEDYEGDEYTCVVRKFMLSQKYEDDTQHDKLFHTRCTVHGSLFDLIIDSGSQENIVGRDVVKRMRMTTEAHPNPYTIGWIKEVVGNRITEH